MKILSYLVQQLLQVSLAVIKPNRAVKKNDDTHVSEARLSFLFEMHYSNPLTVPGTATKPVGKDKMES